MVCNVVETTMRHEPKGILHCELNSSLMLLCGCSIGKGHPFCIVKASICLMPCLTGSTLLNKDVEKIAPPPPSVVEGFDSHSTVFSSLTQANW